MLVYSISFRCSHSLSVLELTGQVFALCALMVVCTYWARLNVYQSCVLIYAQMYHLFSNSFTFLVTQPPALLNISCHKFVNETTGNIALVATWEIKSENISLQERTLEAIDHYDVNLLEGESLTEGRQLLPTQSINLAVRCNESLFSSATKDGYYFEVAYCIRNNSGELQVIGLRPVNNPKIRYHFRVSVFLVLQTVS